MSAATPPAPELNPFEGIDLPELERSLRRARTWVGLLLDALVTGMTLTALVPLASVLWMLLWRGGRKMSLSLFTQLPPAPLEGGGGFGNAILGSLFMVGLATLVTVPMCILVALALERGRGGRLAASVRFAVKVLTGFPSILAGVFAYGSVVRLTGGFSAVAGAIALSILMIPTVTLTAEDALRAVPAKMVEAATGMGATFAQTAWMVLLPTALPGVLVNHGHLDAMRPTASLAVLIYNFASMPFENQIELAWAAALVLVLIVLAANLVGQSLSRRRVTS
jgi:phosphate transport system permease protein